MDLPTLPASMQRIGFHYYPDADHYRRIDLETWLPELKRMGVAWLAMVAPLNRAVPEEFLHGLIDGGIQPVLHFQFTFQEGEEALQTKTLRLLLDSYARWGVRYAVFFDRPNCRAAWSSSDWLQGDLVERFLDRFIPMAEMTLDAGLIPVLPPLAPGGDYWDLSFLRTTLRGLHRRAQASLLSSLALSAEAWVGNRPLDWGAGGPERWPGARPYYTPPGAQDGAGFRIFEWYLSIARQELGHVLPIILLRAGQRNTGKTVDDRSGGEGDAATEDTPMKGEALAAAITHARQNQAIARLLDDPAVSEDGPSEPGIPEEVLAGCFWLLTAERGHPAETDAWFPPSGQVLPAAGALRQWHESRFPDGVPTKVVDLDAGSQTAPGDDGIAALDTVHESTQSEDIGAPAENVPELAQPENAKSAGSSTEPDGGNPSGSIGLTSSSPVDSVDIQDGSVPVQSPGKNPAFDHYLLLPLYAWGAANWDLTLIQPILQTAHPTIGFSLAEARLARRVTVVGDPGAVSTEAMAMLRRAGCTVDRLLEDGTLVAS